MADLAARDLDAQQADPGPANAAAWWSTVETAALLGTQRRPVPDQAILPIIVRDAADAQTRLLDQLALAATWRAAGAPLARATASAPAPPDIRTVADARALQLLDIALTQPPGGPRQRIPAVATWLRECRRRGWRVPAHLIPALLDIAVAQPDLRADVLDVVGERGRWLAHLSPTWSAELAAASIPPGTRENDSDATAAALPEDWIHRSLDEQLTALRTVRATNPAAVRAALAEVFPTAPARDRVRYLELLDPPTASDEDLLESALDDRSAPVRAAAATLLDGLPSSARAARMAARLRPLVRETRSLLRRTLEVGLPDEPDAGGLRDGLGRAPKGMSRRGHDLTAIVAGAPLATWAELTSRSPDNVVATLDKAPEALAGLVRAAAAQRDPVWAQALVQAGQVSAGLLVLLPPERVVAHLKRRSSAEPRPLVQILEELPVPWDYDVSAQVIALIAAETPPVATHLMSRVQDRLHPASARTLDVWLARIPADHRPLRTAIAQVISALSFTTSIREAFR